MTYTGRIRGALFGVAAADALGLPVQFQSRAQVRAKPITGMTGYGAFNKPPGSWSDDSSLTFCLAESLCNGFELDDLAERFIRWLYNGYWSADTEAFDVGNATMRAIGRLREGTPPTESGCAEEFSNGNGSLMRIVPLAFHVKDADAPAIFERAHEVSAVTHAHPVSLVGCGIYTLCAARLLQGESPAEACANAARISAEYYAQSPFAAAAQRYERVLQDDIARFPEDEIQSSGYVVHTLEAALWCLLRHDNYKDAILEAVNLGDDTDTVGAVVGGLAGIHYGYGAIPAKWIGALAKKDDISDLADRFEKSVCGEVASEAE